jgi:hypothetical protein
MFIYILHMCKSLTTIIIWIGILKVNVTCVMVRFDQDASNIGSICSYYLFFRFNLHNFSGEVLTTGYELGCVQCSRFLVMHQHFFLQDVVLLFHAAQTLRAKIEDLKHCKPSSMFMKCFSRNVKYWSNFSSNPQFYWYISKN